MDEYIRELEEDLQREKLRAFWQRFGRWILGAGAVAVVASFSHMGWQGYQRAQASAHTSALIQALDAARTDGKLTPEPLAAAQGESPLAALYYAAALMHAGKTQEANAVYQALMEDSRGDEAFRNLARMRLGQPVAAEAPFHASATEMEGWQALAQGDSAKAATYFTAVSQMGSAPQSLSERARLAADSFKE